MSPLQNSSGDASRNSLGDQELQILHYVTDNAPVSVRAVMAQWGEARGLARTTVLTMLERLRLKGFLTRKKQAGVWVYAPTNSKTQVLQNVVRDFVQKTLGGQIAPFVAYLTESHDISGEELAHLKQLVWELEQEPTKAARSRDRVDTDKTDTNEADTNETDTNEISRGGTNTGEVKADRVNTDRPNTDKPNIGEEKAR